MKDRIKLLRKSENITQEELAKRLEIKQPTIVTWENGRSLPSAPLMTRICEEFGVRREWLEFGRGEMYGKDAPINNKPTLRDCVKVLFEALTTEAQQAVLDAFKDYQKAQQKTQINNGVINGNMTQN